MNRASHHIDFERLCPRSFFSTHLLNVNPALIFSRNSLMFPTLTGDDNQNKCRPGDLVVHKHDSSKKMSLTLGIQIICGDPMIQLLPPSISVKVKVSKEQKLSIAFNQLSVALNETIKSSSRNMLSPFNISFYLLESKKGES
jgi:hypothetical protein